MVVEAIEAGHYTLYCLKVGLMLNIHRFINSYKSTSSRFIKKEYPKIYDSLWSGVFWKRGYFIATTGGANIETIKQYIENQQRK